MIRELHKRIVNQIQHHEYLYDGAWGDITIKVLKNETKEALEFITSRKWKIVKIQTNQSNYNPDECINNSIIINYQKGASIQLYD